MQFVDAMNNCGIHIIAIQETNIRDILFNGGGYHNRFGTGFSGAKRLKMNVVDHIMINNRLSYLQLKRDYRKYTLINVHAATEKEGEPKTSFNKWLWWSGMPKLVKKKKRKSRQG